PIRRRPRYSPSVRRLIWCSRVVPPVSTSQRPRAKALTLSERETRAGRQSGGQRLVRVRVAGDVAGAAGRPAGRPARVGVPALVVDPQALGLLRAPGLSGRQRAG